VVGDVIKQFMLATTGSDASESPDVTSQFLRSVSTSPELSQALNATFLSSSSSSNETFFNATSFLDERSSAFVKMFDQALKNLTLSMN
jgi:hypothetical protein